MGQRALAETSPCHTPPRRQRTHLRQWRLSQVFTHREAGPPTQKIVWQYNSDPPEDFFSISRGGCQELPNGNILIAETNKGRAFEVTPHGEIVWEYYDEVLKNENGEIERGAIYRMTRLEPSGSRAFARHTQGIRNIGRKVKATVHGFKGLKVQS